MEHTAPVLYDPSVRTRIRWVQDQDPLDPGPGSAGSGTRTPPPHPRRDVHHLKTKNVDGVKLNVMFKWREGEFVCYCCERLSISS